MAEVRWHQIKEVAQVAGISIRTLHHYDDIGLLRPKVRNRAGYRLYGKDELLRLQQILIRRELGLSLEHIRLSLDDAHFDHRKALQDLKDRLHARARQTNAMLRAIDGAVRILENGTNGGSSSIMAGIFEGIDSASYDDEVKSRWGDSAEFRVSAKRTKGYSKEMWTRICAEHTAICDELAALMRSKTQPDDLVVLTLVERHRGHIDRWFYPCPRSMHVALADLYDSDSRFVRNIDKHGIGLAAFLSSAIRSAGREEIAGGLP